MKPILFNTEMVCAILEGSKTVTRRVVKPNYRDNEIGFNVITNAHTGKYVCIEYFDEWENETRYMPEPYRPGDIMYVRETFFEYKGHFFYKADGKHRDLAQLGITFKWRPSIHMPREAARIFLRVTDVRVDKLQCITRDGALKEGANPACAVLNFKGIWESTIKPKDRALYGWNANPWAWVIEFEKIPKPV